ncbi:MULTISPECIES: hypothetical protein [unclassified Streptomyces]|uniref:hypothetical protein n=1 Tax=unclassified Streptomyces TaxID=2593676 RepID=UPI0004BD896F|nr:MULTISPECIES: hypothetical protein [unclassified Streptomyces]KMS89129.1 hypothetical protein ACZ91_21735 [Streptomyces regensis]KOV91379.1 hypothetical protein ADL02_13255 [Streptomyces sp. NRRL WC-3723]MBG7698001.1 hypothetical protein [Streptomyces sp. MC1]
MGWGTRSAEADEEALRRAEQAAAVHGLGERTHTQRIGSRITGLGCVSLMPALLCLIFGVGILSGPYGPGVKAVAVGLLVLVAALPVAGFLIEGRLTHRDTRLHVFAGGVVVTVGPARTHALPWSRLTVTERTETTSYGQNSHGPTVHWLYLADPDGTPLARISTRNPAGAAIARAKAERTGT